MIPITRTTTRHAASHCLLKWSQKNRAVAVVPFLQNHKYHRKHHYYSNLRNKKCCLVETSTSSPSSSSLWYMRNASYTSCQAATSCMFHTNQMIAPSPVIATDSNEQRLYKLKSIFETYDLDGNGYIDREELQNMLKKASISSEYAIKMVDESKEPGISFDAFCKLLQPLNNLDFDSIMKYWLKQVTSVEIPDADIIFNTVYRKLLDQKKSTLVETSIQNEELLLRFPREILYLGGAPGAGKGTVTEHILKIREITAPPLVMSSLLDTPHARKIKEAGGLVGDFEVVEMLFSELLKPQYQNGVVIDGFPRTLVQVEVVKRLYDKMMRQHKLSSKLGKGDNYFRRPIFRSLMLFVEEKESVNRQLGRGQQIKEHNKKVQETGNGIMLPLRKTDVDRDAARLRYNIFKEQTYDSLQKLKQYFPYHMINAQGSIEDVKHNIEKELLYQSSLELGAETFATIKNIPTASDVILNARQKLVSRLDDYQRLHTELFEHVAKVIEQEFEEKLNIGAVAGCCYVSSMNPIFDNELARKMVLDIMSDRGFITTCRPLFHTTPLSIGPDNTIICKRQNIYEFNVRFQRAVTMATSSF